MKTRKLSVFVATVVMMLTQFANVSAQTQQAQPAQTKKFILIVKYFHFIEMKNKLIVENYLVILFLLLLPTQFGKHFFLNYS
nr:hypothetical protein [Planctomycetota bacterium]